MKFFSAVVFIFSLFPLKINATLNPDFKGVQVTEGEEDMEAHFKNDTLSSEFCCEREYPSDWAQEISKEESARRVAQVLAESERSSPSSRPSDTPSSGRR